MEVLPPSGPRFDRAAALRVKAAGQKLAQAPTALRSSLLAALAASLEQPAARSLIARANRIDLDAAKQEEAAGRLAASLVKRLVLDDQKLDGIIDGLLQLAAMERADAIGQIAVRRELDDGLILEQQRCPLGVLGVVFESRPDALVQIAGLALRSGNATLLKGGREALATNRILTALIQDVLARHELPRETALLLEDRADVETLLQLEDVVDLVIARGSTAFINHIRSTTRIPVMGHDAGICHLYLHKDANPQMAAAIAVDGKCSYPAACNAIETLLWDVSAEAALDETIRALRAQNVELRGDAPTRARHPDIVAATASDWDTEYGAPVLSIKQVANLDEALAHIARHGTQHTETIVSEDATAAAEFLRGVDAACVFHNASSRFADGYRFGLGAEVGISTDKLHARGPVGVEGLYTYRWLLRGSGQVSTSYGPGARPFRHRDL